MDPNIINVEIHKVLGAPAFGLYQQTNGESVCSGQCPFLRLFMDQLYPPGSFL